MQWQGIRIPVVIMALVVGLAAFWASHWMYNRYNYERPLTKVLAENTDVTSFNINDQPVVMELEVSLGKVDNLQESYRRLSQSVQGVLGGRDFTIILKDQRDQTLEKVYYHARLAAFEAIKQGNYIEMEEYISRRAAGEGSTARVFPDRDYIYIQLNHGDRYLYEIIPYSGTTGTANTGITEGRRAY